jgi:O-antigen ligase
MAALLLVGTTGVPLLVRDARSGHGASVAAAAALGWVWLTSAISPAPRSSLLGFVGRDLSAVVVTLAFGCWALGRCAAKAKQQVESTLMLVASAIGIVAVLQVLLHVDSGHLALQTGRPASLLVNPVYLGALSASGCIAAVASASTANRRTAILLATVVLGTSVSLSGSRIALAALLSTLVVLVCLRRHRDELVAGLFAIIGVSLGVVLDALAGQGQSAANRLANAGAAGRFTIWRYGISAFLERPISGHGVGLFRSTVQERFEPDFVRQHASNDLAQPWFDPHNALVLILTSVGFVGLVLIATWLVLAGRRCGGPLLWSIIPIAASWTLQPVSIHTLPTAMLLFGASYSGASGFAGRMAAADAGHDCDLDHASRSMLGGCRVQLAAIPIGLALAAWIVVADLRLERAVDEVSPLLAVSAAGWYLDDPIVANVVAQVHEIAGRPPAEVLKWRALATRHEPDRPYWWTEFGGTQLAMGQIDSAAESARRALDLQPTNIRSHELLLASSVAA